MRWGRVILRWSLLFLFIPHLFSQNPAGTQKYRQIFGDDYEFAVNVIDNNAWWSDTLLEHNIDPHFALSVVFPELIRYSSIADYIEVKALEVLYVQYGRDYADFSIGLFQMKPTFAEQIEADIVIYNLDKNHPELSVLKPAATDNMDNRRDRITRLKDEYFQLLYLNAFIRVMARLYPESGNATPTEKLLFYATAYNTGFHKGEMVIRCECGKARFYAGLLTPEQKYNYADIALEYYKVFLEK